MISRTGTVGNVVRINEYHDNIFIDDHMIRVIPNEHYSGLVYIYLKCNYGQELIKFQKYGTVQDVINSEYIERIPIPEFLIEPNFLLKIEHLVEEAGKKIDIATLKENQAITLIEQTIDAWQ